MSGCDGPEPRLALSPAEAARALGVSRASIYNWMDDGTIPSVKLGRRRLIRMADIEALLDRRDDSAQAAALFAQFKIEALREDLPFMEMKYVHKAMERVADVLGVSIYEAREMVLNTEFDEEENPDAEEA